ncbi:MAG: hypothetical protein WD669_12535 [Pirellulales bacterium]
MAMVVITVDAQQQFAELPRSVQTRVEKLFVRLRSWPDVSGAKPLSGNLAGHFRLRTGDYRVQFRVIAAGPITKSSASVRVIVEKIGRRDRFYEG